MKQRKIACFIPFTEDGSFGGAERRIPFIFSRLNGTEKYKVDLIFLMPGSEEKIKRELNRYIADWSCVICFKSAKEVIRHLKCVRYDLVCYTDALMLSQPGMVGASLGGSKKMMLLEGSHHAKLTPERKYLASLLKWNISRSDYIDSLYPIGITTIQKKWKNKRLSLTPAVLTMLTTFLSRDDKKENILLFAGRLVKGKNAEMLIEALSICKNELKNAQYQCWICGEGPEKENLWQQIVEKKLQDIVILKGYQHMENVSPKAKIFCSIQRLENYPSQSLLEAIASGCHCIISNVGDSNLLSVEGATTLIEPNAYALSDAICRAIQFTQTETNTIKQAGKAFAKENFSVEHAIEHYYKLFDQIFSA